MIDLATGNYTAEAVQRALHAALGTRRIWYRYERLNQYKIPIAPMSGEEGYIDLAYNAQIMRTGRFVFPDDEADGDKDRQPPRVPRGRGLRHHDDPLG